MDLFQDPSDEAHLMRRFSEGMSQDNQTKPFPSLSEPIDPNKNWLEELVGEDKKYKDPAALAYSAMHKDQHIARLEQEMDALRDDLKSRVNLQAFLDEIKESQRSPSSPNNQRDETMEQGNPEKKTSDFDPTTVEQFLEAALQKKEKERQTLSNYEVIQKALGEKYGDNARSMIQQKAKEHGISVNYLQSIATDAPKVFLELMGISSHKEPETYFAPPRNQTNTLAQSGTVTGVKNWAYYQKLKKADPVTYWSRKIQSEEHDQALKMGDNFYS